MGKLAISLLIIPTNYSMLVLFWSPNQQSAASVNVFAWPRSQPAMGMIESSLHTSAYSPNVKKILLRLLVVVSFKRDLKDAVCDLVAGFAKGCWYLCTTANQITPLPSMLLEALCWWLGPSHCVFFPFTEPGLCSNTRVYLYCLSANTARPARGLWFDKKKCLVCWLISRIRIAGRNFKICKVILIAVGARPKHAVTDGLWLGPGVHQSHLLCGVSALAGAGEGDGEGRGRLITVHQHERRALRL